MIADLDHTDVTTHQLLLFLRAERESSEHAPRVGRVKRVVERLARARMRMRLVTVRRRAVVVGQVQLSRRERGVRRVREPAFDRGEERRNRRLRRERGLSGRGEGVGGRAASVGLLYLG